VSRADADANKNNRARHAEVVSPAPLEDSDLETVSEGEATYQCASVMILDLYKKLRACAELSDQFGDMRTAITARTDSSVRN
jgi:hypothetical protein